MLRKLIKIDKEKCNGCGACADACHEGAIDIIDGKAELMREHFCDGLGDCLPKCPTGAISFEEREAPAYDEEAVKEAQKKQFAKNPAMISIAPSWQASAQAPQPLHFSLSIRIIFLIMFTLRQQSFTFVSADIIV